MLDIFLHDNFPLFDKKKLIVAVSGGMDSMVLVHLLSEAKADMVLVHIDHHTRNGLSSQDALFVEKYAKNNKLPFYKSEYLHQKGNFQKEARDFRYQFLHKVMKKEAAHYIVTAHHHTDAIESFLHHAMRGSGVRGLRGIRHLGESRLRPLVHFTKKEIIDYAANHSIPYVEDETNSLNTYSRNRLRNEVLPILNEIYPHLDKRMETTIEMVSRDYSLLQSFVVEKSSEFVSKDSDDVIIDISAISSLEYGEAMLYHILSPMRFSLQQVRDAITSSTGSLFYSETHQANKDRGRIIISPCRLEEYQSFNIPEIGKVVSFADKTIEILKVENLNKIEKNDIVLDATKLSFPLLLRPWRPGDRIQPSGMCGQSKKVSKILKDQKVPQIKKVGIYVLQSGDDICCIPGIRGDERYVSTKYTVGSYVVKCTDQN